MNTVAKLTSTIALSTMLIMGAAGCSANTETAPEPAQVANAADVTPEKAVDTIEAFVAATTVDSVTAAASEKAGKEVFAKAVDLIDPAAEAEKATAALADFAFVKVTSPKAKFTVTVDASKIAVRGQNASFPVSAIVVKADGRKVANSDALAAHVNDLVVSEGAWVIAFPAVPVASATPSAAPAATATPSAKK